MPTPPNRAGSTQSPTKSLVQFTPSSADLLRSMHSGATTCVAVVDAMLARVEAANGALNACVEVLHDRAREAAVAADARIRAGQPLRRLEGLPILVKVNIDCAGTLSTAGTPALAEWRPSKSAPCVQRLVEEGAKTTASATAGFTSSTAKTLTAVVDWTKLNADGRAPIRNLSADLAEEARIKSSAASSPLASRRTPAGTPYGTPPATFRSRFVHSFSQAPRPFRPIDMMLPCFCFLLVFGVSFYGLVLAPALSFGVDLFAG